MTELNKGQKADQRPKKYLWFGYGNYGGQPNFQIGGGNIRNANLFEKLFKTPRTEGSPMTVFLYIVVGLVGLTGLAILLAWGLSLFLR